MNCLQPEKYKETLIVQSVILDEYNDAKEDLIKKKKEKIVFLGKKHSLLNQKDYVSVLGLKRTIKV